MAAQRHVIKRQVVELLGRDEEALRSIRNRVAEFCRERLPGILDGAFSRLAASGTVLEIDRLELDLGHIVPSTLEESLRESLEHALREMEGGILHAAVQEGEPVAPLGVSGVFGEDSPDVGRKVRTVSRVQADGELLVHFLTTGTLPWWASGDRANAPEPVMARLLEEAPAELEHWLRPLLGQRPVRERLLLQFSASLRGHVFELLLGGGSGASGFREFLVPLTQHGRRLSKGATEADAPVHAAFEAAVWTPLRQSPERFLREWLKRLGERVSWSGPEGLRILRGELRSHLSSGDGWKEPLGRLVEEEWGKWGSSVESEEREVDRNPAGDAFSPIGTRADRVPEDVPRQRLEIAGIEVKAETGEGTDRTIAAHANPALAGLLVRNGGLVLVWPFLDRFFETLGLVEEKQFLSKESRQRAVSVLHRLCTDGEKAGEEHLTLNKVLCGIHWDEPLPLIGSLTEWERAEAEALLNAVIRNWSILKSTSPDGFRRAFLQREAILREDRLGWLLQVERKGWDVLLDRLPWEIAVVKLPWMSGALLVEW